jgi:hypothetical protein
LPSLRLPPEEEPRASSLSVPARLNIHPTSLSTRRPGAFTSPIQVVLIVATSLDLEVDTGSASQRV